jgi:hypothetical protein
MNMSERARPRQARELAKKLSWLTEAQAATGWAVIILLAGLLGSIYLMQASRIATIGRTIQIRQNELEEIQLQNAELERLIAEAQSLERLNAEAVRMGFVPAGPDNIVYVVIPDYPAQAATPLEQAAPAQAEEAAAQLPESMLEAVTLALRGISNDLIQGQAYEQ